MDSSWWLCWTTPSEKIWSSKWESSPNFRGENKNICETTTMIFSWAICNSTSSPCSINTFDSNKSMIFHDISVNFRTFSAISEYLKYAGPTHLGSGHQVSHCLTMETMIKIRGGTFLQPDQPTWDPPKKNVWNLLSWESTLGNLLPMIWKVCFGIKVEFSQIPVVYISIVFR